MIIAIMANDAATISGTVTGTIDEDLTTDVTGSLTVADVDDGEAVFDPSSVIGNFGSFSIDANGD
ncbi:MAG: VCBS domain-containing protein [Pirellulaceae bacterium]